MTTVTGTKGPTGGWRGDSFAHEAFLFDDDEALVARCVPFVREGLDRGEPVLVVAAEPVRAALSSALGEEDVQRLAASAGSDSFWQGGHETLRAYTRDLGALKAQGGPWRLIGQPSWMARPEGRAWDRIEAVANRNFAGMPFYSICPYDLRELPADVVEAALATHPLVWDGDRPVESPAYVDPAAFLRSAQPLWGPPPATAATVLVTEPRSLRALVRDAAHRYGSSARREEMVLAVHEVVANALVAGGIAEVTVWASGSEMVWEVSDPGGGLADTFAGYVPPDPADADAARGLWLARSLADDCAVRLEGAGTGIRLYFRR